MHPLIKKLVLSKFVLDNLLQIKWWWGMLETQRWNIQLKVTWNATWFYSHDMNCEDRKMQLLLLEKFIVAFIFQDLLLSFSDKLGFGLGLLAANTMEVQFLINSYYSSDLCCGQMDLFISWKDLIKLSLTKVQVYVTTLLFSDKITTQW